MKPQGRACGGGGRWGKVWRARTRGSGALQQRAGQDPARRASTRDSALPRRAPGPDAEDRRPRSHAPPPRRQPAGRGAAERQAGGDLPAPWGPCGALQSRAPPVGPDLGRDALGPRPTGRRAGLGASPSPLRTRGAPSPPALPAFWAMNSLTDRGIVRVSLRRRGRRRVALFGLRAHHGTWELPRGSHRGWRHSSGKTHCVTSCRSTGKEDLAPETLPCPSVFRSTLHVL